MSLVLCVCCLLQRRPRRSPFVSSPAAKLTSSSSNSSSSSSNSSTSSSSSGKMAPIRASVSPVSLEALGEFEDLAMPLEVKVLRHDTDAQVLYVSVPNESAYAALEKLSGYSVSCLDTLENKEETGRSGSPSTAAARSSAAGETQAGGSKRKPLPSGDIFYLMTDINLVLPSICLLLLLHLVASLLCCIWSPPLITAAIPLGAVFLLHTLNKRETMHKPYLS
ncbi:hypothetical protein Efla_005089 [Eimeria flavescens]